MHQYRQSCNFIPSVRQPKLWCFPLMRRRHTNTCCWDAVLPSSRPKVCSEWKRIGLHILCPVGIPWREVLTWATGVMPKQLTKRQTVNQTERLRGKKSLIGNKAAGSNIEGQMEKETEEATVTVWEADGEKDRWQADAVEERQVQCAKLPGNCWSLVKHGKDVWDYRPALDNLVYLIREMLQKLFKNDLWWEKSNTYHRLMPESWEREHAFAALLGGQVERRHHKILVEPASPRSKEKWVGNTFEYEMKLWLGGSGNHRSWLEGLRLVADMPLRYQERRKRKDSLMGSVFCVAPMLLDGAWHLQRTWQWLLTVFLLPTSKCRSRLSFQY